MLQLTLLRLLDHSVDRLSSAHRCLLCDILSDLLHFIAGTRAWSDSWLCGCLLSAFSQLEEEDRREELNRKEYAALCLRDADCTDMPLFSPSLPKMNKSSTDIPSVKKLMSSSGCVDAVRCCFCDNSWLFL